VLEPHLDEHEHELTSECNSQLNQSVQHMQQK
jgi:hypothetical protein